MPLTELVADGYSGDTLMALKGMPLRRLDVNSFCGVDLSPLRGMPLTFLDIFSYQGTDLTPLTGMAITDLVFERFRGTASDLHVVTTLTHLEQLVLGDQYDGGHLPFLNHVKHLTLYPTCLRSGSG
jgi:hypothetical protein